MQDDSALSYQAASLYSLKRYKEAFDIYSQLSERNHPECQIFLGWMYHKGIGIPANDEQAMKCFQQAAELSSGKAMFYCGRLLSAHDRHDEAFIWYQKSAEHFYSPALYRLGIAYSKGEGVEADPRIGLDYLVKAAALGHIYAKRELAIRQIMGNGGLLAKVKGLFLFSYVLIDGCRVAEKNGNIYSDEFKW